MHSQPSSLSLPLPLRPQPENFLLTDKSADAKLQATDFGLSSFFQVC